ncbi:MAG TPA: bifunctional precorrin-2 dehydrogenase/sirohydrochlorin ferrochelatase [Chitinispirillaceae bacterium]|nr:bifunctional precorrin-2 dehydrogenase/sirohydrochlorin ferrochelatase [Chitinispirillaceae bacterium]
MFYYPVMLDLRDRKCLIVGGGVIALRKVVGLLRAQARVTVISPEFTKKFKRFSAKIEMVQKTFAIQDITSDCAVVIAATNCESINTLVSERTRELNIPCNVVDEPSHCSFIVPAVVRRGDISVAISTNAASPRFSKFIKKKIGETVTVEYAKIAELMSEIRLFLKKNCPDQSKRFAIWEFIFEHDPVDRVHQIGIESYRKNVFEEIEKFLYCGRLK